MGWRTKTKLIKVFLQLSNVMILAISPRSNVNADNYLCENWHSLFTLYEYSVQTIWNCVFQPDQLAFMALYNGAVVSPAGWTQELQDHRAALKQNLC